MHAHVPDPFSACACAPVMQYIRCHAVELRVWLVRLVEASASPQSKHFYRECLRLSRRNQQFLTNRQFYLNVGKAGLVKDLKYYYY